MPRFNATYRIGKKMGDNRIIEQRKEKTSVQVTDVGLVDSGERIGSQGGNAKREEGRAAKVPEKISVKVPRRRCVGCRTSDIKGDLIRVLFKDGAVLIDATQTKGGRGAYLHCRKECIERAKKEAKRWEYAFRVARGAVRKNDLEMVLGGLQLRGVRKDDHVEDKNL